MPSRARRAQWTDEALYHVLNRGHDRADLFFDEDDRRAFLDLLGRYRRRFHFRLYHYCLMTNHFHLLLHLPDPRRLSALGAGLQRAYIHHLTRRHRFVGHLFQGRFKSVAVQRETYALSCGRYIERNPLEAGMVSAPWHYRWSSAAHYSLGVPDGLVDEDSLYTELSPTPGVGKRCGRSSCWARTPRSRCCGVRSGSWARRRSACGCGRSRGVRWADGTVAVRVRRGCEMLTQTKAIQEIE